MANIKHSLLVILSVKNKIRDKLHSEITKQVYTVIIMLDFQRDNLFIIQKYVCWYLNKYSICLNWIFKQYWIICLVSTKGSIHSYFDNFSIIRRQIYLPLPNFRHRRFKVGPLLIHLYGDGFSLWNLDVKVDGWFPYLLVDD